MLMIAGSPPKAQHGELLPMGQIESFDYGVWEPVPCQISTRVLPEDDLYFFFTIDGLTGM